MKLVGLAGVIEDPDTLIHVAETVRDNGYAKWDCHTPYPVHGLEKAMGLPGSKVPRIALIGGLIGIATGVVLSGIVSWSVGWKTVVSINAIVLSFGVSSLVGIFFGLYPAWRASQMDPITALRHE